MDLVILFLILFPALLIFADWYLKQSRKRELRSKYEDSELYEAIASGQIFVGMTSWQLLDSWGEPEEKSVSVLKTKTKELWRYGKAQRGYLDTVVLEDGVVVGWKQRQR